MDDDIDKLLALLGTETNEELVKKMAKLEVQSIDYKKEIVDFALLPCSPHQDDVLPFWARLDAGGKFPVLCRLARRVLAIPASSAGTERAFSAGDAVIAKRRSQLKDQTAEVLLYNNQNKHLG